VRDTAVFRHSRLQRLLCRSRGLERRHENRQDAQPALHGFRRAHRPEEKPKRLQGMYYNTTYFAYTAAVVLNDNIIMRTKIEKIFTAAFTHISDYIPSYRGPATCCCCPEAEIILCPINVLQQRICIRSDTIIVLRFFSCCTYPIDVKSEFTSDRKSRARPVRVRTGRFYSIIIISYDIIILEAIIISVYFGIWNFQPCTSGP